MSMRTGELARRWWGGELGAAGAALSLALLPAEAAYRLGTAARNRAYDRGVLSSTAVPVPVISVGNIAVGGSGKTPFSSWLAQRLEARGERPAIVHGGYAEDEPALHRAWTPQIPVIVDGDRVRAALRASAAGASVVVLDDAFQHRRLRRDLDIVLVSVERWPPSVRLLPRGPWREPPSALRRAGVVVCLRKTPAEQASAELAASLRASTGTTVVRAWLRADAWYRGGAPAHAPDGPVLLVAGLADPALFAANARAAGARVDASLTFPDHHTYSAADADAIHTAAAGRAVVTTAKDWTKLGKLLDPATTWILTQVLVIEEGRALLDSALERVLR